MTVLPWFSKVVCRGQSRIVFDAREVPFAFTPETVQQICNPSQGVGADGVLLLMPSDGADLGVRMFTADGREVAGDTVGLQALAYAFYRHGYTDTTEFSIESDAVFHLNLELVEGRVAAVVLKLGQAIFSEKKSLDGEIGYFHLLNLDRPYMVFTVDDLTKVSGREVHENVQKHADLPNVDEIVFCSVRDHQNDAKTVGVQVWQPKLGQVSVSEGAAAAAIAVLRQEGSLEDRGRVEVGNAWLDVAVDGDGNVSLNASPYEVCSGHLSEELLRLL